MVAGKVQRGGTDSFRSSDQWEQIVVRYDLRAEGLEAPGPPFVQPSVLTRLMEAAPFCGDPGIASITLHSIATVRDLAAPAAPTTDFQTPDLQIPVAGLVPVAPALPTDFTGRGALPQYLVTFVDGSPQGIKVYVDGNSRLALPARLVQIDVISPPIVVPSDGGEIGAPITVGPGLIVEAQAAAHVAWSRTPGLPNSGILTFTQTGHSAGDNLVMIFERPPFAKRVVVIPPATAGAVIEQLCSPTLAIALPPPVSNQAQVSQGLSAYCTHVRVTLAPGSANDLQVHAIWELSI